MNLNSLFSILVSSKEYRLRNKFLIRIRFFYKFFYCLSKKFCPFLCSEYTLRLGHSVQLLDIEKFIFIYFLFKVVIGSRFCWIWFSLNLNPIFAWWPDPSFGVGSGQNQTRIRRPAILVTSNEY